MKPLTWVLVCVALTIGCSSGEDDLFSKAPTGGDPVAVGGGESGGGGSGGEAGATSSGEGGTGGEPETGGGGSSSSGPGGSGGGSGGSGGSGTGGDGTGGAGGAGGGTSGPGGSGSGGSGGGPLGCTPGEVQCTSLNVETCDGLGQWQFTETCDFVCSAGVCTGVCSPTDQQCSGNVPETCDSSGQWVAGAACPFVCSGGACTGSCTPGEVMCAGTSTQSCDISGSWAAPVPCPTPAHADPTCTSGVCGWTCQANYDNCNGNPGDGCEVNLTLPASCGSCGNQCNSAGGTATCSMGSCGIVCDSNHDDCNGNPGDGCEVPLGTTSDCLGCGDSCPSPANAVGICTGGGCDFDCLGSFVDCDGNPATGCEIDTSTSLTNCGGCGTTCVGVGAACVAGECNGPVKVADTTNVTSLALGTPYAVNEVYWTTSGGTVEKAPSSGGNKTTLASGQNAPEAIQTNGVSAVWSNSTMPKVIRSVPVGGGMSTDLATGYGPVEMTHDGVDLFFTTRTAYDPCFCSDNSSTSIYKLSLGGGVPAIINPQVNANSWPGWPGLVVIGNYVERIKWVSTSAYAPFVGQHKTDTMTLGGIGNDGVYINAIYETFSASKFLVKNTNDDIAVLTTLSLSGPGFVKLHEGESPVYIGGAPGLTVRGIAIDNTTLYVLGRFGVSGQDRLISYPLAGGGATYLIDNMYNASNILVDGTHVYWTIEGTKDGVNPPVLAPMVVRYEK